MNIKVSSILLSLILIFTHIASSQSTEILEQDDAPLTFQNFEAKYQESSTYRSEGIRYEVEFSNYSNKKIVAYSIGFFAFDVFKRSLGRPLSGFSIDEIDLNNSGSGAWLQRTPSASLFKKYGTAVAYVERVRFVDGTIWEYDSDSILTQLQKFEESLTIDDLQSEDE